MENGKAVTLLIKHGTAQYAILLLGNTNVGIVTHVNAKRRSKQEKGEPVGWHIGKNDRAILRGIDFGRIGIVSEGNNETKENKNIKMYQ